MLTPEEHAKVRRALDLLQEAQNIVGEACQELCPIGGFANTWGLTCKLYDKIKAHWHLVEARRVGSTPPPDRRPLTSIPPDLLLECQAKAGITAESFTDEPRIEVEIPIEWETEAAR
jgi:hypothetical protein